MSFNVRELNDSLTSEQFELLIRHRIEREFCRLNRRPGSVALFCIETGYDDVGEIKRAYWSVGEYNNKTEGDLLHQVVDEYNRRLDFDQGCRLKIIEHQPGGGEATGDIGWDDPRAEEIE